MLFWKTRFFLQNLFKWQFCCGRRIKWFFSLKESVKLKKFANNQKNFKSRKNTKFDKKLSFYERKGRHPFKKHPFRNCWASVLLINLSTLINIIPEILKLVALKTPSVEFLVTIAITMTIVMKTRRTNYLLTFCTRKLIVRRCQNMQLVSIFSLFFNFSASQQKSFSYFYQNFNWKLLSVGAYPISMLWKFFLPFEHSSV